jgi:hypothetical protein
MPQPTTRSAEADTVFLTALENAHSVRNACAMARYARRSVYRWRAEDPEFAALWATAVQMAGDLLEEEADRRGRDGYDVPVFHRGEVCGTKRMYANGLLLARLKAIRPDQYREGRAAAAPSSPQPVTVTLRDFTLEDLVRRLMRGEAIDRTTIPLRIQKLIDPPDSEAGH